MELAAGARDVVTAHVDNLTAQLARIIADGIARGEFHAADPDAAARAVFDATACFHHPAHAHEWSSPETEIAFAHVRALIMSGLDARVSRRGPRRRQCRDQTQ